MGEERPHQENDERIASIERYEREYASSRLTPGLWGIFGGGIGSAMGIWIGLQLWWCAIAGFILGFIGATLLNRVRDQKVKGESK